MNDRLTVDQILDGWLRLRTDRPELEAKQIARQLGVNFNTMRSVVQRARRREDPRAVPARPRPGGISIPFDPCTLDEGEQS